MIPDGIKERMADYSKGFRDILTKEFLNLPYRQQEQFLAMVGSFMDECKKIHEESTTILERIVTLEEYKKIENGNWEIVYGTSKDVIGTIEIKYPKSTTPRKYPKHITFTVYSIDGKEWYSSKDLLIRSLPCSEK